MEGLFLERERAARVFPFLGLPARSIVLASGQSQLVDG